MTYLKTAILPKLLIGCLIIFSFLSFWRTLSFDFLEDDYFFLWNGIYHPFAQFINFKHPGSPFEAFLLSPILGLNQTAWILLGFVLKLIASYLAGVFLYKLTNSRLAGILAAIFSSVSFYGMYAIHQIGSHITSITSILILIALIYLVKSVKESEKYFWKFVLFLTFSILPDPARALPIFLLLPFIPAILYKSKKNKLLKSFLVIFYIIFFTIGIPLLSIWYFVFSIGQNAQIEYFLRGIVTNPGYMITKTKYIGDLFATVSNLFTNLVYGLQPNSPKFETVSYTRLFGIEGVVIFFVALICLIYFLRRKSIFLGIISFLIFWVFVFYFPDWISEPRLPMDPQHHYLTTPSIGFILLIAYLFSFIKNRSILVVLSVIFIVLNIYKANLYLSLEYPYRSTKIIESSMKEIVSIIPKDEPNQIILLKGNEYWLSNSIVNGGNFHFLLLKKDSKISDLPQITFDEDLVFDRTCSNTSRKYYNSIIFYPQIPLSHVFAFYGKAPGVLLDITKKERKILLLKARQKKCSLMKEGGLERI